MLEPLLVRHDVNVVFSGHEHIYERTHAAEGHHLLHRGLERAAAQRRRHAVGADRRQLRQDRTFMLVEIAGDQMVFQTISRTGRVVDSGVIHRGEGHRKGDHMKAHALSRTASPWLHGHRDGRGVGFASSPSFSVAAAGRRDRARLGEHGAESYFRFAHTLAFPVNEIGMAVFIGLITQEAIEARHARRRPAHVAALGMPIVAAAGGLLGSTFVYLGYISWRHEEVLAQAWPIACAIDMAAGYYVLKTIFRRAHAQRSC